jgi:putative ABC transport system ATP-binding protein
MLRIEELEVHGLKPVSLEIASGECIAIQGPSGSGKTVLLRAIADLDPARGKIALDTSRREALTGPEWRKSVRYAAAEPGWWAATPRAHFSGADGLDNSVKALGLKPSQLDQSITQLSTGERQRMALLRAIADKPAVLLLDEPTGALDANATARAERVIRNLLKKGAAIVLVSHDPAQVKRLATRTLMIRNGRLTERRA